MKYDVDDLVTYVYVVREQSFSGASRHLNKPKSTISRSVSRLEDDLGVKLLHRTTRKLKLTDAGAMLYNHGQRIVEELEEAAHSVQLLKEEPSGLLRVTAPVEMGTLLIDLAACFLEQYPEVNLEFDLTNRYVDIITEGFDAAIRAAEHLDGAQLMAKKLGPGHTVIVATPKYLDVNGQPEDIFELEKHQAILFPNYKEEQSVTLVCDGQEHTIKVKGRLAVNSMLAAKQAALTGMGLGYLPESFCRDELSRGSFVKILPEAVTSRSSLWLVYPGRRYPAPKLRAWVDFVTKHFSF